MIRPSLAVRGDLDGETYPARLQALREIPHRSGGVRVDMAAEAFCDLVGLRAIIRLADTPCRSCCMESLGRCQP